MGRPARFLPENTDGVLVEVAARVIGARALMVPAPNPRKFNEIAVGVIGRAMEVAPLDLCSCSFLANHFHAHAVVHEQQVLSRFMQHLSGNLSKEVGRVRGWRGTLWEGRYNAVVVGDEAEAQWARLKYVLSQGVREGLVESPLDWPGVHAARALVYGEPLEGVWFCQAARCTRDPPGGSTSERLDATSSRSLLKAATGPRNGRRGTGGRSSGRMTSRCDTW